MTPFDFDAFNEGFTVLLNVLVDLPGSSLSGTAQDSSQSIFFPSSDPDDGGALAKMTHNITSVNGLGFSEWRMAYDPSVRIPGDTYAGPGAPLGGVIYSAEQNIKIAISIKCECWDLTASGALKYIERARSRLNLPSFTQALRDLNVAQNDMSPARNVSYTDDTGHAISAWQFDLILNAAQAAIDDPVTTIKTVGRPRFVPVT